MFLLENFSIFLFLYTEEKEGELMLDVVICEDNLIFLEKLSKMVESILIQNNIEGNICFKCENALSVLDYVSENSANVFILDIHLPSRYVSAWI